MHAEHHRRRGAERDRVEVLERIERDVIEQERVVGEVAAGDERGVAVGRRLRRAAGADVSARAAQVFDEEILPRRRGELLPDQAGENIGGSARSETDDELDRPRGPCFGGNAKYFFIAESYFAVAP
jgi:hypothetical protein